MKALVIAPQPFFSPRGTPFSVYYRTLVTAELGVTVDLLTYGEGQDVDIPGVRIIRIPRFAFLGNVKVGPSGLKLFLDCFLVLWTLALLLRNRYDFVHAHEEAVFYCRFLKPLFGFKLVYDMHSSLPQQLSNFRFTTSRLLIKLFEKLEDSSLRAADAVITICPDLAQYATSRIAKHRKHLLIENSIYEPVRLATRTAATNPHKEKDAAEEHRGPPPLELPQDQRFVVYAGTLEPYQGVDLLVASFPGILMAVPNAYLVVVGGTPEQVQKLTSLAQELGIHDHSLFTGRVPQIVARSYLAKASVQISPRREGTNTPLKVYEQLDSGIPLVATNIYSHTQVLNEDVAFLVPPTPEGLAEGVVRAMTQAQEAEKRTAQARRMYAEHYSRPIYEDKMRRLLELVR